VAQLLVAALALLAVYGLKRYYAQAQAASLGWILTPTVKLVTALTGLGFEATPRGFQQPQVGFTIVPACAGVNFLAVAFATLALVYAATRPRPWQMALGLLVCAPVAYLATIAANGARISGALWLHVHRPTVAGLSPGTLHQLEGALVYLGGLFALSLAAQAVGGRKAVAP
jgi:exosortase K